MEAFSRRSSLAGGRQERGEGPSSPGRSTIEPIAVSPARLSSLFTSRLNEVYARFEDWTLPLVVTGRLGSVPADTWRRYEPLPLQDLNGKEEIGLEVTYEQLEKSAAKPGEVVEATGFLRARLVRGQVVPRFETLALRPYTPDSQGGEGGERLLESLVPDRHDFPTQGEPGFLLVDLATGTQALEQIEEALGAWRRQGAVRSLRLGPHNRQELLQALLRSPEEIIVLVVNSRSLPLLQGTAALKAMAASPAYRMVVTEETTGAEVPAAPNGQSDLALRSLTWLADRVFASPVEAGRYLRERCSALWQKREEARAREEEIMALRDSLAQLSDLPEIARSAGLRRGLMLGLCVGGIGCFVLAIALVFLLHRF
ncbi:hypothetical protein [Oecophyllibacter saccharovorans]|uniref:hypothetical protein n=1 Tax=Oecophyllibacter saccharovorans TaxID=2558360 RepID=UPI0011727D75|nr:hypothetical protein [Oecophyllibacter saccharovorans]TPW36443.1 hypothetical protein E3203_01270 [Oecophyllibacter saccharovorans]